MSMANKLDHAEAKILIASDSLSDAMLARKLLNQEFDHVFISTDPDLVVQDFEKYTPDVLVLAFNAIGKSEGYYLGLYRLSEKIHSRPHRTIILCNKDEVSRVYSACLKEYYDDYVLFWPMTNDAPRLLMSIHLALRDLSAAKASSPSSSEFAAEVRRLAELGNLLNKQMVQENQQIDVVNHSILKAEQEIGVALDEFTRRLLQGELPDFPRIENSVILEQEIKKLKQDEFRRRFQVVAESLGPVRQRADEFKKECLPHIESVRALNAMADRVRPMILVVDDDDFQRQIVGKHLGTENYNLVFATGGVEALNILRKMQPDLIIMDIVMSELDGIETTRRLKAMPQFARVPVIMTTGKSEGSSVRESIKAGATNFVVKPFDRETLLAKVANALKPP